MSDYMPEYITIEQVKELVADIFQMYRTNPQYLEQIRSHYDISPADLEWLEKEIDYELFHILVNIFLHKPLFTVPSTMISSVMAGIIFGYSIGVRESGKQ